MGPRWTGLGFFISGISVVSISWSGGCHPPREFCVHPRSFASIGGFIGIDHSPGHYFPQRSLLNAARKAG
jgi:hypothetical protein